MTPHRNSLEVGVATLSIIALIVGGVLIYRASPAPVSPAPVAISTPAVVPTVIIQTGSCHYRTAANGQTLPDPACTPGAIDPRVTQANIQQTICRSGYTATDRPPVSFTEPLKRRDMVAYGQDVSKIAEYELDHLVPLELGGAPMDEANLWPEGLDFARVKDRVENAAREAACAGRMNLPDLQKAFMTDWTTLARQLGVQ